MDVGNADFRFRYVQPVNGGYETNDAKTIRQPTTSELHINSLDRFEGPSQPLQQLIGLTTNAYGQTPAQNGYLTGTNFTIGGSGRILSSGYFNRLAVSEYNLSYKLPTIITGYNDIFYVQNSVGVYACQIVPGFYNQTTLAAALQVSIRAANGALTNATVSNSTSGSGYTFTANATGTGLYCLLPLVTPAIVGTPTNAAILLIHYRVMKMIGAGRQSFGFLNETVSAGASGANTQISPLPAILSTNTVNLLPTDYIDVVSQTLGRYSKVKSTNTTDQAPTNCICRIYFPQPNGASNSTSIQSGSAAFNLTKQYTQPNWLNWSPGEAITSIDILLLDQYGQQIYWTSEASTEINLTLLLSES